MGMFKDSLKVKAAEHHQEMLRLYPEEIKHCVDHTFLHSYPVHTLKGHKEPKVVITDLTSVDAVFEYASEDYRTAVLNFASYKHPGGMFLNGSKAQEESLCHESILYEVLQEFDDTYYASNRSRLNYGLYLNRALYTEDMLFIRGDSIRQTDVITCAAPNMHALQHHPEMIERNDEMLHTRARFVCQMAAEHNIQVLILGAWGCGVFQQDPYVVAKAFKDCVGDYSFDTVVFAIMNLTDKNGRAFCEVFEK